MTTSIMSWTPFGDLDTIERAMRRTFGEIGMAPALLPVPPADVYETADEVIVELEVPGYESKELEIQLTDHTLGVTGSRTEAKETSDKAFHLKERFERKFERFFELPMEADTQHVTAHFTKGVLEVHMPKIQTEPPRKVEITSE